MYIGVFGFFVSMTMPPSLIGEDLYTPGHGCKTCVVVCDIGIHKGFKKGKLLFVLCSIIQKMCDGSRYSNLLLNNNISGQYKVLIPSSSLSCVTSFSSEVLWSSVFDVHIKEVLL